MSFYYPNEQRYVLNWIYHFSFFEKQHCLIKASNERLLSFNSKECLILDKNFISLIYFALTFYSWLLLPMYKKALFEMNFHFSYNSILFLGFVLSERKETSEVNFILQSAIQVTHLSLREEYSQLLRKKNNCQQLILTRFIYLRAPNPLQYLIGEQKGKLDVV